MSFCEVLVCFTRVMFPNNAGPIAFRLLRFDRLAGHMLRWSCGVVMLNEDAADEQCAHNDERHGCGFNDEWVFVGVGHL